ncbi:MAG: NAD(P)H-dependent oxidoreductase [Clostridia bacterium]|jgi:putative NADPH-quinone reductase|nr:NAD(P)H-dependent oxidoreductase [Clostridia bacterium]
MNRLIVYSHPYEGSLNKHILMRIKESYKDADVIDLHEDNFNPVLDASNLSVYEKGETKDPLVIKYQDMIKNADKIIFVFPIWWADMPAMVKGFIDKVMLKNFAYYIPKKGMPKGYLNDKEVVVINTLAAPKWVYKFIFKNPVKKSLINATLKFCGIKKTKHYLIDSVKDKSKDKLNLEIDKIIKKL